MPGSSLPTWEAQIAALLPAFREVGVIRACVAQLRHWGIEKRPQSEAAQAAIAYHRALTDMLEGRLPSEFRNWLDTTHRVILPTERRGLRTTDAGVLDSESMRMRHIEVGHTRVSAALDDLAERLGSERTDIVERLAARYYFTLKIHPFDDGNGRLARLSIGQGCCQLVSAPTIVDVTRGLEKARAQHDAILSRPLSDDALNAWSKLFRGLLITEVIFLSRLSKGIEALGADDRRVLHMTMQNWQEEVGSRGALPVRGQVPAHSGSVTRILEAILA